MTSPQVERRKEIEQNEKIDPNTKSYLLQDTARDALKKSMAKKSMAK